MGEGDYTLCKRRAHPGSLPKEQLFRRERDAGWKGVQQVARCAQPARMPEAPKTLRSSAAAAAAAPACAATQILSRGLTVAQPRDQFKPDFSLCP